MEDYKYFMNVLMESDILVDNPITSYVHMNEIERNFQSGQYFKSVMHLACLIQSNLYQLTLQKLPLAAHNFKTIEVKRLQEIPLSMLINWVAGETISKKKISLVCYPVDWKTPLITPLERKILHSLKEIRNDLAHVPFLTYDINIKKEGVRKIIEQVIPIHRKLVQEIIKNQKEIKIDKKHIKP